MPLLQRIRFADDSVLQPLFFRKRENRVNEPDGCPSGESALMVLDSFYNACFVGNGGWPDSVGNLVCHLYLAGDFDVSIVFRTPEGRETVLETRRCLNCAAENPQTFCAPPLPKTDGRLYPVLRSLKAGSFISGGEYHCSNSPRDFVRLGVVICTYRREDAVLENLRKVAEDPALSDIRVCVVDNGRSLRADVMPGGYQLLPNENRGGAGGFSRGLLTLLEQGDCTHVVLMDDDVRLDTEALLRAKIHFGYAPGTALASALLSLENPCSIHEAGADLHPIKPLKVIPRLAGTNLGDAGGLAAWQRWEGACYGGFWFFGVSLDLVRRAGMLLPMYMKADDVEFGLRLSEQGIPLTIQAGVGVHHRGFSDFDPVKRYCWVRNMLIVRTLQDFPALFVISGLLTEAMKELLLKRSGFLLALARGTEDFLKGPSWMEAAGSRFSGVSIQRASGKHLPLIRLWFRVVAAVVRLSALFRGLRRQWRKAAPDLASPEYWKRS